MTTMSPHPHATAHPDRATDGHDTIREGFQLGILIALATLAWVVLVDLLVGEPFRTMLVLGGPALFSAIHVALCIAYGLAIMAAVHSAMVTPSVVFAMIFLTILFQAAFVMVTAFAAQLGLGALAWPRLLAGNVLAAALTWWFINRRHSLATLYHAAEEDA